MGHLEPALAVRVHTLLLRRIVTHMTHDESESRKLYQTISWVDTWVL